MKLQGKVVVVSGGASGLGRGAVDVLASQYGARAAALDIAAAAPADWPAGSLYLRADVTDEGAVREAVASVLREYGRIDVCINCAGVPGPLRILDRTGAAAGAAAFARVVGINLIGTFHLMSHCAAAMLRNEPDEGGERGVVINTSSGAAFEGQVGQSGYAASKAAVVGMTLPAARELARHGIRVNAISPGLFDTPMARAAPALLPGLLEMVEFPKRLGDVTEFARLCAHICENRYFNGADVRLDAAARLRAR